MRPPLRSPRPAALVAVALTAIALGGCTATTDGHLSSGSSSGSTGSPTQPGSSAASSTPAVTVPKASLHDCSSVLSLLSLPAAEQSKLSAGCASIAVPLDYTKPDGSKISVTFIKIHKSGTTPIGSLMVNPGGPGGSAVETALGLVPQLYNTLLDHFDLVGFDPRGVGNSTPVRCLTTAQKDKLNADSPDMLTAAGRAEAKADAHTVAAACEAKYGSELPYFNTVNTARDMDLVRQALGEQKINYLGFSYGTELGAQYLHLFPSRMRVAVLDGAVDPLTSDITQFADQLQGFEGAFDQFAAWCVKNATCKAIGTPRAAVKIVVAKADKVGGLPVTGDSRRATSSLIDTGVLEALYSRSDWPTLGTALREGLAGSGKGLLALADQYNQRENGQYTNLADANVAISCNDSKVGPSDATIAATAASWATRFPLFGLSSAASLYGCQQWQTTLRTVPPLPTAPTTPRKVLVIGNLHDPATPYQGAKDLTKTLGNAELLSWNGEGHTSYLEGSSCIDTKVNAYLVSGTLPAANTLCPA